ncbi:SDR family NAD(P)-dependent oxidoreductase [Novosphingobium bradum]|uniref:SDR family NAD(P)-dependent oxidoreductase n=1 Tax=Novosphingobium bradum TaxID=1737444 RepID=A0ABV7IU74_9SPHN
MSSGKLADKVAIVTGGGSGVGEATCERLARAGAAVVVADINLVTAEQTAERIRVEGHQAIAARFDLLDAESINALAATAMARFGRIDVLHNNAVNNAPEVFHRDGGFLEMDSEVWDKIFAGNVRGQMELTRAVVPHMIAGGRGGSIINTSSGAGTNGQMTMSAYGASKGALNSMTHYMAVQFAPHKIRCNTLILPAVLTRGLETLFTAEQVERLINQSLLKEPTRPDDIAAVVEFLASDDSRVITGKLWAI